ncbi:class I SAM-dependent RNA methyltransferase [Pseudovibrio sp. SPO723]|uniref:class I SAM-dependent RNA methyltransferase n=1 Tax=Nesiotobacter zosterae TaxID=392721 RepID=UPI0029C3C161|nr:class I SAM-dependent RNA methyltransferase [Pseudovibrio sp. SPO723]MDX5593117.1 class I SAM-dependent RNA methyltransferase [Pseudovibrio sp. SPO723]
MSAPELQSLTIDRLAHKGDGVANLNGEQIFVSGALPGETITVRLKGDRAELVEVTTASPERAEPICKHYGSCGGCTLQHMSAEGYSDFKRNLVVDALKARGIEVAVDPVVSCAPQSRRRAVFTAVRAGHKVLLGYHEAKSHRLVDVEECPVLVPEIVSALPKLRRLASEVMPRKGDLKFTVTATLNGLDVAIQGLGKNAEKHFLALSQATMEYGFARLTADGETILEIKPPQLDMGGTMVTGPSGGFLQATKHAENVMAELVMEGIGKAKRVADLFSGTGTFTFRIAKVASVHAAESDAPALKALDTARRVAKGLKQVTTERRDLFRRPLNAKEMDNFGKGYDAVVFDPPRAGAQAQAKELANSPVKRVVAVSCNPATLARDLRELLDGGYVLKRVTPIDQFLYSPHIEVVAQLERAD